jgi:hypothetical protein
MSENTKELQPQLAATVDEARSIKNEVTEKVAERSKDCLFLKTLPIEIRNEIYKLLLFNEDLSDIGYLEMRAYPEDEQVGYCLSPSILATCRQIYEEGQDILYGMNTFFFDTREGYNGRCFSPVMRKWTPQARVVSRYGRHEYTPKSFVGISTCIRNTTSSSIGKGEELEGYYYWQAGKGPEQQIYFVLQSSLSQPSQGARGTYHWSFTRTYIASWQRHRRNSDCDRCSWTKHFSRTVQRIGFCLVELIPDNGPRSGGNFDGGSFAIIKFASKLAVFQATYLRLRRLVI